MDNSEKFRQSVSHNLKFKLYMFKQLPSAFFSGIKLVEISEERSVITIPFKYLTKNPFRSMYFASQAMAAELSTGILALSQVFGKDPRVSMLVFDMRANFIKKAISKITFECNDGIKIKNAVEESIKTGEGVTIETKSVGHDVGGQIVSEFYFTWTFKPKTK